MQQGRRLALVRLVLAHLQERPRSGRELLLYLRQSHEAYLEPGTLWAVLQHLERRGWIEILEEMREGEPLIWLCYVTDAGFKAIYQDHIARPAHQDRIEVGAVRHALKEWLMSIMKWILRLYPLAWRERYEDEMRVLLEEYNITWRTILDVLFNALYAHLDPNNQIREALSPQQRLRHLRIATVVAFCALPCSIFFYFAFINDAVDGPWYELRNQPVIAFFNVLGNAAYAIMFLSILIIIGLLALRGTSRHDREGKALLHFLPLIGVGGILLTFICASLLAPLHLPSPFNWIIFAVFFPSFLSIPTTLALAIARLRLSKRFLYALLTLASVATLGLTTIQVTMMVDQAVTGVLWPGGNWSPQLIVGFILMIVPIVTALVFLVRCLRLLNRKGPPAANAAHQPFATIPSPKQA